MNISEKLGVNQWGQFSDFNRFDDKTFRENIDYDFSMMNSLPISWVRLGMIYYDNLVQEDGSYNFSRLDYVVNKADSIGLNIILPVWFVDDGISDKSNVNYANMLAQYKQLIVAMVKHYAGRGITYEAIDEATGGDHYWLNQNASSKMNDILMMHQFFKDQVRFLDTTANFIAGDYPWIGASGMMDRFETSVNQGMLENIKSVSFHPYLSGSPEQLLSDKQLQKELKILKRKTNSVGATEFGYAYPGAFNGSYTREQQTNYTLREIFLLDYLGIDKIIYFTMDNSDVIWSLQKPIYQADVNNSDNNWIPLAIQFKNLFNQLYDYSLAERISTNETDFLLRYVSKNKSDLIVGWTTFGSHNAQYNDKDFNLTETPQIFRTGGSQVSIPSHLSIPTIDNDIDLTDMANQQNSNAELLIQRLNQIGNYLINRFGITAPTYAIPEIYSNGLDRDMYLQEKHYFSTIRYSVNSLAMIFNQYNWLLDAQGKRYELVTIPYINSAFTSSNVTELNTVFNNCSKIINKLVDTLIRISNPEEVQIYD